MRRLSLFLVFAVGVTLFSRVIAGQSPSAPTPVVETGLQGVISIGPIHGGPTREGVPDSKPLAHAEFVITRDNSIVASFQTDGQGQFKASLPPGHYTISGKERRAIGGFGPFEVDIAAGEMKRVQWSCDSGIR